jgi:hypothetical protein
MNKIKKILGFFLISLIHFYQFALSPLIGRSCRHIPTCSNYTIQAITEHGPLTGAWLGMKRISRCHPWGTKGYDPVPPKNGKE